MCTLCSASMTITMYDHRIVHTGRTINAHCCWILKIKRRSSRRISGSRRIRTIGLSICWCFCRRLVSANRKCIRRCRIITTQLSSTLKKIIRMRFPCCDGSSHFWAPLTVLSHRRATTDRWDRFIYYYYFFFIRRISFK